MLRRIGCWTLLIASALWAQGCAHNEPVETKQQSSIQKSLVGTWSCSYNTHSKDRSLNVSVDGKTTMRFTDTQIFADGVSTWLFSKGKTRNPVTLRFQNSYQANYTIIEDTSPKIVYYIIDGSVAQISTDQRVKEFRFESDPLRRNESTIIRLTNDTLVMRSLESNKGNISITNIECLRIQ